MPDSVERSTPVAGALSVTPLYTAPGDEVVWWDGASWQELVISGGSGGIAEYLYLPSAPATVFSGADYHGKTLALDPTASDTPVYLNGVKLLKGLDYSITASAVTMLQGAVGPPNTVEILAFGAAIPPASAGPGPAGPAGPQGPQGPAGASGTGTFIENPGASTTLADGVAVNLASLALGVGDWTVNGSAYFSTGTAVLSTLSVGANAGSAVLPAPPYYSQISPGGGLSGGQWCLTIPERRLSLSVTTQVYLVALLSFGPGSTVTGTGHLQARGSP